MQFFSIFLIVLCLCFSAKGQQSDYGENFAKGLQAYQKADYEAAVKYYEKALSGSMKSAQAYSNLGLAYHKAGDLGRAVLNFERALRQEPGYAPAKQNLRAARQLIDVNIKATKGFWLFKAWENFVAICISKTWSIIFWAFLFIGLAALLAWYLRLNSMFKTWGLRVGIGFLALGLIPFMAAWHASSEEYNSSYAIVVGLQAGIRTAPGLDGEDIMVVSTGVKARISEQTGDWYRVRLENGVLGWVPAKAIERI
jgi:tetratricopeptide (TPR) repeat protein